MTLVQQIADAEAAYHDLMTGKAVVEVVDQNGERVRYQTANASDLLKYVQNLKSQLPNAKGSGPMRFWF